GRGTGATLAALMPGFALFGVGAGLMNVPLTNTVIDGMPREQAGIAGALLNNSREMAGLLGVTVIGAVLRARQGAAVRGGSSAPQAFLDGYHARLWGTITVLAGGVVVSYVTLRPRPQAEPDVLEMPGPHAAASGPLAMEPVPAIAGDASRAADGSAGRPPAERPRR